MTRPESKPIARILAVLLWLVLAMPVAADDTDPARRIEEQKREDADAAETVSLEQFQDVIFTSGAWINYRFFQYENSDHDKSLTDALRRAVWGDARVWGRLTYQTKDMKKDGEKYFIHVRVKDVYVARSGRAPGARFDNRGPALDYGYAAMERAPWQIEAGRRYFNIGRGIVFSGVYDGVQLNYKVPGWNVGAFVSKTLPHAANIDSTIPGYDKESRRYFAGLGVGYAGFKDHQIYGYTVIERDHSRERPQDDDQDYGYDAQYAALGAKGAWSERWPYGVELVREWGHSREYPSNALSNIAAWAVDAQQKYRTMTRSNLVWSAEYAAGSGDADRSYVHTTRYGNTRGRDKGFMYFGYIPTGIALSPMLSNIHIMRLGADLYPFYAIRRMQKILLGLDYYHYWKQRSSGGIYDADAGAARHDVGQEFDLRIDWKMTRRLTATVEYGYFIPGDAYWQDTRSSEKVLSLSVSLVF